MADFFWWKEMVTTVPADGSKVNVYHTLLVHARIVCGRPRNVRPRADLTTDLTDSFFLQVFFPKRTRDDCQNSCSTVICFQSSLNLRSAFYQIHVWKHWKHFVKVTFAPFNSEWTTEFNKNPRSKRLSGPLSLFTTTARTWWLATFFPLQSLGFGLASFFFPRWIRRIVLFLGGYQTCYTIHLKIPSSWS